MTLYTAKKSVPSHPHMLFGEESEERGALSSRPVARGHVVQGGPDHVRGVVRGARLGVRGQAELSQVSSGAVRLKDTNQELNCKFVHGGLQGLCH